MLSVEYNEDLILIKEDSFNFERSHVLSNLLDKLEYDCQLDFKIHFRPKKDTFVGVDGVIQPNELIDIFNAFVELKDAFENVDELNEESYDVSYELLLKRSM